MLSLEGLFSRSACTSTAACRFASRPWGIFAAADCTAWRSRERDSTAGMVAAASGLQHAVPLESAHSSRTLVAGSCWRQPSWRAAQPDSWVRSAPSASQSRTVTARATAVASKARQEESAAADDATTSSASSSSSSSSSAGSADRLTYSPLHLNIEEFCRQAVPMAEERRQRDELVKLVRAQVVKVFEDTPQVKVDVFGSYANGMGLWSSDLDLVVTGLHQQNSRTGGYEMGQRRRVAMSLTKLLRALRKAMGPELTKVQLIAKARVPIIKFVTLTTKLSVDICMTDDGGVRAAQYMVAQARSYPPLRPLVLVLKTYLKRCGVADVATGGLGSYSLTNMVIAHLQEELKMGQDTSDLGETLYGFLVRYSVEFNYGRDAVSVASGGIVTRAALGMPTRASAKPDEMPWSNGLLVDCPLEGRDVSGGTFRMDLVRKAFDDGARELEKLADSHRDSGHSINYLSALFDVRKAVSRKTAKAPRPSPLPKDVSQGQAS